MRERQALSKIGAAVQEFESGMDSISVDPATVMEQMKLLLRNLTVFVEVVTESLESAGVPFSALDRDAWVGGES